MKNPSLSLYDFISILFPSILLISFLQNESSRSNIWELIPIQVEKNYGEIATMLVVSYIFGHVISFIAFIIEKHKKFKWITLILKSNKSRQLTDDEIELNGKVSPVVFPQKLGEEIIDSLRKFYGMENIDKSDKNLFNLVYSPVYNRMDRRDIFLALANMMRSLAIVFFISSIWLLCKTIHILFQYKFHLIHIIHIPSLRLLLFTVIFSVMLFLIFRKGYQRNKYYSETIPYLAFLAWYKEKNSH